MKKENYQTFEAYLEEVCPDTGRGGADSAQEACERWIENLDVAEVMDMAESWERGMYRQGSQDLIDWIKPDVEKMGKTLTEEDINLGLNAEEEAMALDTLKHEEEQPSIVDGYMK